DRLTVTGAEWALRGVIEASRRRPRSAARRRIPAALAAVAVTTTLTAVAATAQGETRGGTDVAAATVTTAPASPGPNRPAGILPAPARPGLTTDAAGSATVLSAPGGTGRSTAGGSHTADPPTAGPPAGGPAATGTAVPPAVPPGPERSSGVPAGPRREAAPPPGHTWWNSPDGYRIAVPEGWSRLDIPGGTAFRAGADRLRLSVTAVAVPPSDVVAELEIAEMETSLPGYRRLRLEALPARSAAVWEYTFRDRDGASMRSLRRVTTSGGRTFVLEWQSTRQAWATNLPDFTVILASFATRP
ncbi:hypothetical protein AB0C31_10085, partial [Actinoplanes philippinensis]